jgi:Prolipoprotein diacylglyceryltransferase
MIPYIEIPSLEVAGTTLSPFGILCAIGCIVGWLVARREAVSKGLDPAVIDNCLFWTVVPGFFTSRLFDLVFYNPELFLKEPWSVFLFWKTMSSFGGFFGGAAGVIGYLRYTGRPVLRYLDCLIVGLVVGFPFGRLGCAIVHDHPGSYTSFPLGVVYPDGTRHDLGLYECLFTTLIMLVVMRVRRDSLPPGELLGWICVAYAPVRFLMDFLRVADRQYMGLTPGQYFAVLLLSLGLFLVVRARHSSAVVAGRNVGRAADG